MGLSLSKRGGKDQCRGVASCGTHRIGRNAKIAKESKLKRCRVQRRQSRRSLAIMAILAIVVSSKFLLRDTFGSAHVWLESIGDDHAAVGLLVVFKDRQPGTADGQTAAVERVHELRLLAAFGT